MEVRAIAKYVRVQPRKVRIVADEIRQMTAVEGAHALRYHPSKSASALRKVLVSAIANAMENHGAAAESLRIAKIAIDEGPRMKRITQKAMGRGARIKKKTSHIMVVVEDFQPTRVKPHGTKAKARPKFEAPKAAKAGKGAKTKAAPAAQEHQPVEETPQTEESVEAAAAQETAAETAPAEEPAAEEAEGKQE